MAVTFTAADFEREAYHFYKAYAGDIAATICGGYHAANGIVFAWSLVREDRVLGQGTALSMEDAIESINASQLEDA